VASGERREGKSFHHRGHREDERRSNPKNQVQKANVGNRHREKNSHPLQKAQRVRHPPLGEREQQGVRYVAREDDKVGGLEEKHFFSTEDTEKARGNCGGMSAGD
jgi:hypothetical protein